MEVEVMYLTPIQMMIFYAMAMYFSYGLALFSIAPRSLFLYFLFNVFQWTGAIFGAFLTAKNPKLVRLIFISAGLAYFLLFIPPLSGFLFGFTMGSFWTILPAHFMLGTGHGKRSGFLFAFSVFLTFAISMLWGNLLSFYNSSSLAKVAGVIVLFFTLLFPFFRYSYSRGMGIKRVYLGYLSAGYAIIFSSILGMLLFRMGVSKPADMGLFMGVFSIFSGILSYIFGHLTDIFGGRREAIKAFSILLFPAYIYASKATSIYALIASVTFINALGNIIGSLVLAMQADLGLKGIENMAVRQLCFALSAISAYLLSFSPKLLFNFGIIFTILGLLV